MDGKTIIVAFAALLAFGVTAQASVVYYSGYQSYPTYYTYPSAYVSAGYYNGYSSSASLSWGSWNNYWNGHQWVTPGSGYYASPSYAYYPNYYNTYYPSYYNKYYPAYASSYGYQCQTSCYWASGYYTCGC